MDIQNVTTTLEFSFNTTLSNALTTILYKSTSDVTTSNYIVENSTIGSTLLAPTTMSVSLPIKHLPGITINNTFMSI